MAKYIKTRKGNDGFYYPYTSPDLVIDEDGKSTTTKFSEINTQLENIGQSTQEQINTSIDKAIEEGKMHSDASKLSIIDENNNFISTDVEGALDKINDLDIFYYKWKNNPDETHIGVSAQQVQTIFPELVKENDTNDVSPETENYLTVDYQCLNVAGLQAIKELYQLVKQQQNKIDDLETRLANLESNK